MPIQRRQTRSLPYIKRYHMRHIGTNIWCMISGVYNSSHTGYGSGGSDDDDAAYTAAL